MWREHGLRVYSRMLFRKKTQLGRSARTQDAYGTFWTRVGCRRGSWHRARSRPRQQHVRRRWNKRNRGVIFVFGGFVSVTAFRNTSSRFTSGQLANPSFSGNSSEWCNKRVEQEHLHRHSSYWISTSLASGSGTAAAAGGVWQYVPA